MAIVVTVTDCKQVGMNAYRDIHTSRIFEPHRTIDDMLSWARATLGKDSISICDLQLSEFTGSSL